MSHKNLRTEKNCLNCGHEVSDRYCSNCGQENLELDDSAFHLVLHYIQDLFHYDGKLWHTLKTLVTRPGQVACEYMEGKRNRHLEPIRFYVFASSVFFLTVFLVFANHDEETPDEQAQNYKRRIFQLKQEKKFLNDSPDTVHVNQLINSLKLQSGDTSSTQEVSALKVQTGDSSFISVDSLTRGVKFDTLEISDLSSDSMGWIGRALMKRVEEKQEKLEQDDQAASELWDEILHSLPQTIFLSLPFFALFLKLLYWRSRKGRYVEHFIFSVYNYAYLFTIFLFYIPIVLVLNRSEGTAAESLIDWVKIIVVFYPFVYLFLSMKRFYNDRFGKLIIRYMTLMALMMITILMLFLLLAFITFLL